MLYTFVVVYIYFMLNNYCSILIVGSYVWVDWCDPWVSYMDEIVAISKKTTLRK